MADISSVTPDSVYSNKIKVPDVLELCMDFALARVFQSPIKLILD